MKYFSLNNRTTFVDFKEATIRGQAPDKGLYFPQHIPMLDIKWINEIESLSNEEIAYRVIRPYVGDVIPQEDLYEIVKQTVNFPVPLVKLSENIFSLEMYHGNTLAFKDIGARFMSRCLAHFVKGNNKKVTVLVATSGDTGGAVADGFYNVDGVDVVILYPSGKVSKVQEKQLTSLGSNIHALEVKGTFDDCQQMVKKAFVDDDLIQKLFLTSANSINVARWLPQQFFYFFAYKQWPDKSQPPVVCVPSGNFGNICSAILAHISGLPLKHFIAACNANDVVPDFMKTFEYRPKKAVATISNAMDVGDPSNFIRILELFQSKTNELSSLLSAYSISDEETAVTIQSVDKENNYLLDPHGAVGYLSLKRYLDQHTNEKGFFAETAHPVKFYDVVEPIINRKIELPQAIAAIMDKPKYATYIENDYDSMKTFLMSL
jgi:threonine synthase